jgi:hypothetical protein
MATAARAAAPVAPSATAPATAAALPSSGRLVASIIGGGLLGALWGMRRARRPRRPRQPIDPGDYPNRVIRRDKRS